MRWLVYVASMIIPLATPSGVMAQKVDLAKIEPLIIEASEELRRAWMRSDLSISEYRRTMDISCNAFTMLSQDDNFENLLVEYQRLQYHEGLEAEIRQTFSHFRSFLEFLIIERDLLLDAGLSEEAVDSFLGQMVRVRSEARGFKIDAQALLTDVRRLASQACSASESVSEAVEKSVMQCNVGRLGVFAIGAGATVVDGVALFVTKIPQAAATASGMLGAVLMAGAAMMPQC